MSKAELIIKDLGRAITSLEQVYLKLPLEDRINIDATIQRFEYTFELFWKTLKVLLNTKGIDVSYPRDVLKEAHAHKLILDERLWVSMLKDMNSTSHIYNEKAADAIYARIKHYVPVIRKSYCIVCEQVRSW